MTQGIPRQRESRDNVLALIVLRKDGNGSRKAKIKAFLWLERTILPKETS